MALGDESLDYRVRDELDPYYAEPPVVRRFSLRERFEASSAGASVE